MFDSIVNYFFIFIVMVIFIGRTILQARSRHKKESSPPIPVHFEDEDEGESIPSPGYRNEDSLPYTLSRGAAEYSKGLQTPGMKAPPHMSPAKLAMSQPFIPQSQAAAAVPVKGGELPQGAAPGQAGFFLRLNQLSQLKQAVVMAEILGPPKGLE